MCWNLAAQLQFACFGHLAPANPPRQSTAALQPGFSGWHLKLLSLPKPRLLGVHSFLTLSVPMSPDLTVDTDNLSFSPSPALRAIPVGILITCCSLPQIPHLTWMVPAHHPLLEKTFIFLSPHHPSQSVHRAGRCGSLVSSLSPLTSSCFLLSPSLSLFLSSSSFPSFLYFETRSYDPGRPQIQDAPTSATQALAFQMCTAKPGPPADVCFVPLQSP